MRIAALLPHVEVYGGVRRYLEIGNELHRRGFDFVLFTPKGEKPGWLEFNGSVRPFSTLEADCFDIGLCSEYSILSFFDRLEAGTKFFYFVLEGHKKERQVAGRNFQFLGCSEGICRRVERKYRVACLRAVGGINPGIFYPWPGPDLPAQLSGRPAAAGQEVRPAKESGGKQPEENPSGREFRILCYGRIYKKRKGVHRVVKAVEGLRGEFPGLRLIFFDSLVGEDRRDPRPLVRTSIPHDFYIDLPQSRMAWLYSQADAFVSAERRAGWANSAAEAMACGLPVVCTRSGTRDFALHEKTALVVPFGHPFLLRRQIRRLIRDEGLRRRLAQAGYEKIREFTWESLALRLEAIFQAALSRRAKLN
jgi:glycosyltransferase involved in cell wall biosynthesis